MQRLSTNLFCKYKENLYNFIENAQKNKSLCKRPYFFENVQKLDADVIINLLLSNMKRGTQFELMEYFYQKTGNLDVAKYPSKSAFSQAREKIQPSFFLELSRFLAKNAEELQPTPKLYKGYRLVAVDGTTIYLPKTKKLVTEFGETKNQHNTQCLPRCSILMDVLNGWNYNSIIGHTKDSEKKQILLQLDYIPENSILILDRLYPSAELIYELNKRQIKFVIRCANTWNAAVSKVYIDKNCRDKTVTHKITEKAVTELKKRVSPEEVKNMNCNLEISYRILKVKIPDNEASIKAKTENTEMLLTNIFEGMTEEDFQKIYNYRWGVETGIDVLKNKLAIESLTGHSPDSVYQDFYATICRYNIAKFLYQLASEELANKELLEKVKEKKPRKNAKNYKKQVNMALSIHIAIAAMRINIADTAELANYINLGLQMLIRFPEPIRPQRRLARIRKSYKQRGRVRHDTNFKRVA